MLQLGFKGKRVIAPRSSRKKRADLGSVGDKFGRGEKYYEFTKVKH